MGRTRNTGLSINSGSIGGVGSNSVDEKINELANKSAQYLSKEISPVAKKLLNEAKSAEAKDLIKQLYRPGASIGDGGTADALRYEKANPNKSGNKSHEKKAAERIRQIKNILSKNPNHQDKQLFIKILNDLEDALYGGK